MVVHFQENRPIPQPKENGEEALALIIYKLLARKVEIAYLITECQCIVFLCFHIRGFVANGQGWNMWIGCPLLGERENWRLCCDQTDGVGP